MGGMDFKLLKVLIYEIDSTVLKMFAWFLDFGRIRFPDYFEGYKSCRCASLS